ncbi:hypothetical protein Gorai_004586 [Gossypium raimondii]|uniref:Uncharacterized protein n=2 Tax=Gossypium TaxID=3633 RepID=A0A7J8QIM6_GOSRA|nr:hypothetical protein [Gossypium raimondii]MBA0666445.1 hypothetical protein [Gossypium klotzschianum]
MYITLPSQAKEEHCYGMRIFCG